MNYKVLSTLSMTESQFEAIKARLLPRIYDDRDDALAWCRDVNKIGGISWSIEADDGTFLSRRQICREIDLRASQLVGRPKKYG